MLAPSQDFIDAIQAGEVKVAELFDFTLSNGITYYYTTHSEVILWNSPAVKYEPLPLNRESISKKINLEVDEVTLNLAGITGDLAEIAQNNVLDGMEVTIKRVLWNETYASGMEITLFKGTADIAFNRKMMSISCHGGLNSLGIMVPKNKFQEPCNHQLFDVNCGLDESTYKVSSSATLTSTSKFIITDAAISPPSAVYYNLGEIRMTSGANLGQRRMVRKVDAPAIYIANALPNLVQSGDTFDIYPGCDLTPETCRDTFSNIKQFLGFSYVPQPEETTF